MDKKELESSISYCGLICKLCHLAAQCDGCNKSADKCDNNSKKTGCYHRNCCIEKKLNGCWECPDFPCQNDMYSPSHDIRIKAFARFMKEEGPEKLIECITANEERGIHYGYKKDYDGLANEEAVIALLLEGQRK